MNRHQKILIIVSIIISCISVIFSILVAMQKDQFSFTQATYQGIIEKFENSIITLRANEKELKIFVIPETQGFIEFYTDNAFTHLQKTELFNPNAASPSALEGMSSRISGVKTKQGTIIASHIYIKQTAYNPSPKEIQEQNSVAPQRMIPKKLNFNL